jgi:beta-lactamase class A
VLTRVDRGEEHLDRRVPYSKSDLLEYAPVTSKHVAEGGMTLGDLCAAAIELSDNTAANLILASLGGPSAVTTYARSLGDEFTRLDRTEPTLNTAIPGDPRDTTTPAAMARDMQNVLLGNALSAESRGLLESWLDANQTSSARLRAGFPSSWRIGDKTGTGGPHTASGDSNTGNDIAIARRPQGAPLIVTVYLTGVTVAADPRDAAIASIGRVIAEAVKP